MFPPLSSKKLIKCISAVSFLALAGCHTLHDDSVRPLATPIKIDGQAVTSKGENFEPSFSPDGQKIVYVSTLRTQHRHAQIYEMDLKTHHEKRLTYQGAQASTPQYSPKGDWILYASATDELKEDPPILHDKSKDEVFLGPKKYTQPFEIYFHRLNALEIQRLTKRPGFDGEAKFISPTNIVFTRAQKGDLTLMEGSIRHQTRSASTWRGGGPRAAQLSPSKDAKKFTWIEYSEDFKTSSLKVKVGREVKTILADTPGLKLGPSFTPDGNEIIFTLQGAEAQKSEIYGVHVDGSCLIQITKDGGKSEEGVVSPAGDALIFVSDLSGGRQLYLRSFKVRECPATLSAVPDPKAKTQPADQPKDQHID
jgi:hypothetical protein